MTTEYIETDMRPLNIWNDITKTHGMTMDLCFEGGKVVAIHNSGFTDIVNDLDFILKGLSLYRDEMARFYGVEPKCKKSFEFTRIYIAFDEHTGLYKIGRSMEPERREKTLMSEKPTIRHIYVSDMVPFKTESELHRKFKHKRGRGEWFNLDQEDISFIKNYIDGRK